MLILCTRHAYIEGCSLSILECIFRCNHGNLSSYSGLILRPGIFERFLVIRNRLVEYCLHRILPAKLEEKHSETGLLGQPLIFEVGRADLCRILGLSNRIANPSP